MFLVITLKSPCLSVCLCVRLYTKILVSVKALEGVIKSHLVTALVCFAIRIIDIHFSSVKPTASDGVGGMYLSGSADGSRPGTFFVNVFRKEDKYVAYCSFYERIRYLKKR